MQPRHISNYRFRQSSKSKLNNHQLQKLDLLKWTSIITPFVILLGILRLYSYYSWFGINIISFLDFGEIITSVLDFIIVFLMFNVPVIIAAVALTFGHEKFKLVWCVGAIFLEITIFFSARKTMESYLFYPLFVVSLALLLITGYNEYLKRRNSVYQIGVIEPFLVGSLVLLWLASGSVGSNKARLVIQKKIYSKVWIVLKDSTTLPTDSLNYYIGNTAHYVFVYSEKAKKSTVIKMEDVQSITFPNNDRHIKLIDNWISETK